MLHRLRAKSLAAWRCYSKMTGQIGEGGEFEEILACRRLVNDLVFENPGKVMRDEDGVQSCTEGRVYVRARAVADHPCIATVTSVVNREG